jgi:predicted nucleotidyltransferase
MVRGRGWSPLVASRLLLDEARLAAFCDRWQIAALELFGSILRDDFHSGSDVDMLVTFHPGARWGLLDHSEMEAELSTLLQRRVDLLTRRSVERSQDAHRRAAILDGAMPLVLLVAPSALIDA